VTNTLYTPPEVETQINDPLRSCSRTHHEGGVVTQSQ